LEVFIFIEFSKAVFTDKYRYLPSGISRPGIYQQTLSQRPNFEFKM